MSAELRITYPRKKSLIPTSSWNLELIAEEDQDWITVQILYGDNDRPTGAWSVPLSDLKRLIAFAQPDESGKAEKR